MIVRLSGKMIDCVSNWIALDVQGVGYKVFCNNSKLVVGNSVILYVHHYIREDQQALYGFKTKDELYLFELLITVNGVGPKAAMAIMSSANPDRIIAAISSGDVSLFKAVSGIGQKVAAKIIVELKNKVGGIGEYDLSMLEGGDDVVDALESLGYKKHEIISALRDMPTDLKDTQAKVTWALKALGRSK